MWPYWFLFLCCAIPALLAVAPVKVLPNGSLNMQLTPGLLGVGVITALMVGLRYRVGGDWVSYDLYLLQAFELSIAEAFSLSDPGYWILNVVSASLGFGIAGVNLFCGSIFVLGLVQLSRTSPQPWLALAIAVPYFVIVVSMGYTRQAVAIGFVMLAIASLVKNRKLLNYAVLCLCGALFHMSAVIMIPLAALLFTKNRLFVFGLLGAISALAFIALVRDSLDGLIQEYILEEYASAGTLVRLSLTAIPASIFLLFRDNFKFSDIEKRYYTFSSIAAVGLLVMFFVTDASTALDRLGLYFIPLQLVLYSRLPSALFADRQGRQLVMIGLLIYSGLTMAAWFAYSGYSRLWTPYRTMFEYWLAPDVF